MPNPKKPGKKMVNKALYSKKFNGPGLRYEIVTCILTSDIVSLNGPFAPGDWNDLEIFRSGTKNDLEPGERCEGDDIYVGEAPKYIKCLACITCDTEEQEKMSKRVQGRLETLIIT